MHKIKLSLLFGSFLGLGFLCNQQAPLQAETPLHPAENPQLAVQQEEMAQVLQLDSLPQPKKDAIMEKITKEYLTGRFDPARDERFTLVPATCTRKTDIYMRRQALESFKKMQAAAKKDGINLMILSATRPFNIQRIIWEAKFSGKRTVNNKLVDQSKSAEDKALQVLEFNSMPGTSRHHWGTDIDINSVEPAYFETTKGKAEYAWLSTHAPSFGFCQVYSQKGPERPVGYEEEKWHWSYLPISVALTEYYGQHINNQDIVKLGFLGSEVAEPLNVVETYVLGIAPSCKIKPQE